MKNTRPDRKGAMLGVVLVATLIAGALGFALMDRSLRALRTGGWGRDHLALRLLAESVAEELHLKVQQAANRTGDPLFDDLRRIPAGDAYAAAPVRAGAPSMGDAAARELERRLGGKITLKGEVVRRKLLPVSNDPLERCGLLRYEATAQLTSGRTVTTERVRTERAFRIARVTPPRPLDQLGLFVGSGAGPLFAGLPENTPVFAAANDGPQSLIDMVTSDAIKPVPQAAMGDVARAIQAFAPQALSIRAHYVTSSAGELGRLLSTRLASGGAMNGLVHNTSREDIELAFPSFRGKCMISTCGSVRVGDIQAEDPARDSLTIVSMGRIIVVGKRIDAVLVNFSDAKEGVVFGSRTHVRGGVLSSRFPVGMSLSGLELGSCQIEHPASLDSGDAPSANPDANLLSRYVVAFSPHPVSLEHQRDSEEWSSW